MPGLFIAGTSVSVVCPIHPEPAETSSTFDICPDPPATVKLKTAPKASPPTLDQATPDPPNPPYVAGGVKV